MGSFEKLDVKFDTSDVVVVITVYITTGTSVSELSPLDSVHFYICPVTYSAQIPRGY